MGITQEQVTRILNLRSSGLTLREIGQRMGLSHDTIGKVVRGERGATRDSNGRMIYHSGRRSGKTSLHTKLCSMIPRTQRERELADFWYERGVKETNLSEQTRLDKREVKIIYEP